MKEKKKKVYCEDCRYAYLLSYCSHSGKYTDSKLLKEVPKRLELNQDGKCPHYKREWWKFWA